MGYAFRLQVGEPGKAQRVVTIDRHIDVGRDCEGLVLEDALVSRRHLSLEPTAAGVVLIDLGSANGTLVDGDPVAEPVCVSVGSVITVGETQLVVHAGREGDSTAVETDADDTVDERSSRGKRELGRSSSRTARIVPPDRPPG